MPFLLNEFHRAVGRPEGLDAHGAPSFFVDVIEADDLSLEGSLLFVSALSLRHVIRRDEVRASCAARMAECAVFLDKFKEHHTLI